MANTVIFPEQTVTEFFYYQAYAAYVTELYPAPFTLVLGETYSVYWDGSTYECQAQDASAVSAGCVLLGNGSAYGLSGNNEPFAIVYATVEDTCLFMASDDKTEHTIAIQRVAVSEPELEPLIVLKDLNGDDNTYADVEKVELNNTDGETVMFSKGEVIDEPLQINLDFTNGNQTVEAPEGYLVKSAVIAKPTDLLPENILKDKDIGGVIGTAELGGGGSSESSTDIGYPEWIDDICFWDIDGTLIKHISLADIKNLASLPEVPQKNGLTFVGWDFTLDELKNVDYPRDVGAMYTPTDGKTHIKLSITNASYLTVPLNYIQTVDGGVTISWGDGSTSTPTGTTVSTTHKYSETGNYEIVLTVADGCTLTLGGGTSATSLVGSSSYYRNYVTEIHMANGVELSDYALYFLYNCKYVILPTTIQDIPNYNLYNFTKQCKSCIIPNSVISIGDSSVYGLYTDPKGASINGVPICLPDSIKTIGTNVFKYCHESRRCILPKNLTSLPNGSPGGLYKCLKVFLPDSITTVENSVLTHMKCLQSIKLPAALETIGNSFLQASYSLRNIEFQNSLTTMGDTCFSSCVSIKEIVLPNGLVSTGNNFAQSVPVVDKIIIPETFIVNTSNQIMPTTYYIGDIILKNGTMFKTNATAFIHRLFALKPLEKIFYSSSITLDEVFLLGDTVGELAYATIGFSYIVYVRDELVNDYKTKYQNLHSADYPHSNVYPISQYIGKLPPEVEEALKQ